MPSVTINGNAKASAARAGRSGTTPAADLFHSIANAPQGTGISDLHALAGMPSQRNAAFQFAAQMETHRLLVQALRTQRMGGRADLGPVNAATSLLGRMGGMTPEYSGLLSAVQRNAGPGTALVPYRMPGVPALYQSSSRAFQMVGGPYASAGTSAGRSAFMVGQPQFGALVPSMERLTAAVERLNRTETQRARSPVGGAGTFGGVPLAIAGGTGWSWGAGGPPPGAGGGGAGGGGGGGGPAGPALPNPHGPGAGFGGMNAMFAAGAPGVGRFNRGMANGGTGRAIAGGLRSMWGALQTGTGYLGGALAVATMPQTANAVLNLLQSFGDPYRRFQRDSWAVARAGNFGGAEMERQFYGGAGSEIAPWMRAAGIGPQESLDVLRRYGFTPRSANEAGGITAALTSLNETRGFAGMGFDRVAEYARNARLYGGEIDSGGSPLSGPGARGNAQVNRVAATVQQMSEVLERAVASGLDRSTVLRSMEGSMEQAARAGASAIAPGSLQSFQSAFLNSGTPGGMSGISGADAQARIAAAGENPLSNAGGRNITLMQAARGATTEAGLISLLDRHSGGNGRAIFDRINSTGAGQRQIAEYLEVARSGNSAMAAHSLGQLLTQNAPEVYTGLMNDPAAFGQRAVAGMPSYAGTLMGAGATGLTPSQIREWGSGRAANSTRAGDMREYFMRELGISREQAAHLVSAMHAESGLNPTIVRPGGRDFGIAQWVGRRRDNLIRMSQEWGMDYRSLEAQQRFVAWELQNPRESGVSARLLERMRNNEGAGPAHDYESGGAAMFNTPGMRNFHSRAYQGVMAAPTSGGGVGGDMMTAVEGATAADAARGGRPDNIPRTSLNETADSLFRNMQMSATGMAEFGTAVQAASGVVRQFSSSIESVISIINNIQSSQGVVGTIQRWWNGSAPSTRQPAEAGAQN